MKNNPDKFPDGYVIALTKNELETLRWKISTAKFNMTRVPPKVFTEKGVYVMLNDECLILNENKAA